MIIFPMTFFLSLCFFLNGPGHCRDSPTRAWIRARWLKGRSYLVDGFGLEYNQVVSI